ncbi:MAG: hypothetical protein K2O61_03160, partial [Bacteroidaceae bacterium]|nr:hypothetical protein [Bacteroidaceae bacterium]
WSTAGKVLQYFNGSTATPLHTHIRVQTLSRPSAYGLQILTNKDCGVRQKAVPLQRFHTHRMKTPDAQAEGWTPVKTTNSNYYKQ